MKFIPASELKKKYEVFGHFYSVIFPCGNIIDCRSVLEIIDKSIVPSDINTLHGLKPDCIFIMMNPGSSRPLDKDVEGSLKRINSSVVKNMRITYVSAKPDTTQYQVMRVMKAKGWGHVRVLNLSDLRNPKSGEFITRFNEVENYKNGHIHSIFSSLRCEELEQKMNRKKGAPVVCAWGVSDNLNTLIGRCLERIDGKCRRMGVCKDDGSDKYYHPLPTLQRNKEEWVRKVLTLL